MMKIAVVGATGRIGTPLTKQLLAAGHHVKALSRGGPSLDALVKLGAEPIVGSFDTGDGALATIFEDADAAFLMVKTDWKNIRGHYPAVAQRFVDALAKSPVKLAVSLTAVGSDVAGTTGHAASFYQLDQKLNELEHVDLVHLRAGWFMENMLAFPGAVAKYGKIGWGVKPDVKLPWIATQDIAELAAHELTHPTGEHRGIREVGAQDLTMPEVAAIMSREINRPVSYTLVDRSRKDIEAGFFERGGTPELWIDDGQSFDAINDGRVRFHGERAPLPTTMEMVIRDTWKPLYLKASEPESFLAWSAGQ